LGQRAQISEGFCHWLGKNAWQTAHTLLERSPFGRFALCANAPVQRQRSGARRCNRLFGRVGPGWV